MQDYVTNDLITLSCPICQEGLLQKSGNILFDLFESNYIKIKQKNNNQKLNSKKNNFKKLNKCRKHQLLADIYCEQCSTFFCKKCLNIHDEIGNGHHSLNKQTNPASLNSEENIFKFNCMIHEEEKICFFCEKCHELICNICFNNIHKEHKVSKINIFVKKALKNILNYRESNFNLDVMEDTPCQYLYRVAQKVFRKKQTDIVLFYGNIRIENDSRLLFDVMGKEDKKRMILKKNFKKIIK